MRSKKGEQSETKAWWLAAGGGFKDQEAAAAAAARSTADALLRTATEEDNIMDSPLVDTGQIQRSRAAQRTAMGPRP